ncbi:MAG: fructose-bisphosphate aldolase class I [Chlamydiales bacterium]|jgi:fructose-bisphosphate aldolase class I
MTDAIMQETIEKMTAPGKGILAADESSPTIAKRFQSIDVESTEDKRCEYRELLFTTQGIEKFIHGVILFEETLSQSASNGKRFPDILQELGIVPGIKVDKGLAPLANSPNEKVTQGLDGLSERLAIYKDQGAQFAKWRAVYTINNTLPSSLAIQVNAECLARYAAICQEQGFVPIVEPEVLMAGTHDIARSEEVHKAVIHEVFQALHHHKVKLEYIILKPSMVISGSDNRIKASTEEVAEATIRVLRQTVPAAVPTINFLSGGQSDIEATAHLNAMNALGANNPWLLSFSYGRALQAPALQAWSGKAENKEVAQQALYKRAVLNAAASKGKYVAEMETEEYVVGVM